MHDDDLTDELDVLVEALVPTKRQQDEAARAPEGFNPAAMFLLRLGYPNLFEAADARPGAHLSFRCKGCGTVVSRADRERHYVAHKRRSEKVGLAKTPNRLYRDTTTSGTTTRTTTQTHEGDNIMAKTTTTSKPKAATKEPRVLKTKIAREAAIDVLTKAQKPMTMDEIVTAVMKRKPVTDAGVPKGTVQAQVNFELAEETPKIYRVSRGVYALVGVEAPAVEETPAASVEVTPDPKPAAKPRKRSNPTAAAKASAEHVEEVPVA